MSKPDPIEAIERDLSESRSNLKENVHALSEKLTLGKIVDELVFDSKIDWSSVGGKTADTMKSVLPGAILGAGAALLLANGGLSSLLGNGGSSNKRDFGGRDYHPGYDPVADWRADAAYRNIEGSEDDLQQRPNEDDDTHWARRADHHAKMLGHVRNHDEDEHSFRTRVHDSVDKAKQAAVGARDRLARAAGHAKHGMQDAMSSVAGKTSAGFSAAGHTMHASLDSVRDQAAKVKDAASDGKARVEAMYADNPVLGLAIGIGIGALLGAAIPMSRQEEQLLSKPVGKATAAVADLGGQAMDKLDAMATDALKSAGAPVEANTRQA